MNPLFQRSDASVSFYIGHLATSSQMGNETRYRYTTFPITLVPPEHGSAMEERACPGCHTTLRLRVRSASAVEQLRTRLRVIASSLLVYVAVDLVFLFPPAIGTWRKVCGASLALAALGAIGLFVASSFSFFQLAVALKAPEGRDHAIFETAQEHRS